MPSTSSEPPFIRWVEEPDATGELAEIYAERMASKGRSFVADILKCMSACPDFLKHMIAASDAVHFSDGHLNRRQKEAIATFISGINRCPY